MRAPRCRHARPPCTLSHPLSAVDVLRTVLELGRAARDARSISLRKPVISITVVSTDPTVLEDIKSLEGYVRGELNMRSLNVDDDDRKWCTMKLALNMRLLGRKLGRAASAVRKEVGEWCHDAVKSFLEAGSATVQGHEITREEVEVVRESAVDASHYEAAVSADNRIMVVVDVRRDDALVGQGLARELVSTVQKLRKDAGLKIEDRVHAFFGLKGSRKAVAFFEVRAPHAYEPPTRRIAPSPCLLPCPTFRMPFSQTRTTCAACWASSRRWRWPPCRRGHCASARSPSRWSWRRRRR